MRTELQKLLNFQAFAENFTGLELEDGGGRGTSGELLCLPLYILHAFE